MVRGKAVEIAPYNQVKGLSDKRNFSFDITEAGNI